MSSVAAPGGHEWRSMVRHAPVRVPERHEPAVREPLVVEALPEAGEPVELGEVRLERAPQRGRRG